MQKFKKMPKPPLVGAAILLVLGVALMAWPEVVLGIFPPLLGAVLALAGAIGLAHSLAMRSHLARPGAKLLQSVLQVVVGIIFMVKRDFSLGFLAVLFGLYVLASSVIRLGEATAAARAKQPWAGALADGLMQLVLGVLLLFAPFSQRMLWARFLGVHFVVAAANTLHWLYKGARAPGAQAEDESADA